MIVRKDRVEEFVRRALGRTGAAASATAWLIGAAAVSPAMAQTAAQPAADSPPEPVTLEEIIVTGTKRAENVQSVPASVFVATQATMERAGVRDFDDLPKIVPSLTITKT